METYAVLTEAEPDQRRHRRGWTLALGQLGQALTQPGADAAGADALLAHSLQLGLPLLHESAHADDDLRTALSWTTGVLAGTRLARGDAEGAVDAGRTYLELDPRPVELVWTAYFLSGAVAVGRARQLPPESLEAWTQEALYLLERAAVAAPGDPEVHKEIGDPGFAPIAAHARYRALLEDLGIGAGR